MFPIVVERGSSKHRTHMMILMAIILVILIAVAFILPEYQVGSTVGDGDCHYGLNLVLVGGFRTRAHAFIGLGALYERLVQDFV